jgi:hypothetical protein
MKDKVVFETNVPVEVCLTHSEGKEIAGRREVQVMFDLADGRLMFVPQSVRDQIRKLEVKPGERFQICKREVDDKGEPCIEWTVSRLASQAHSAVQLIQSAKNASPAPSRSDAANNNGGSGHAGNEAAPKRNGQARLSYIMQMALEGALDASKAVEAYAEDPGIIDCNGDPFRFSNADIRAIGLTMFIEARKRDW